MEDLGRCLIQAILLTICKPDFDYLTMGGPAHEEFWCTQGSTCDGAEHLVRFAIELAEELDPEDWIEIRLNE